MSRRKRHARHARHRSPRPRRRARDMIKVLPSLFTLGNLLCGFAAIFYASRLPDAKHLFQSVSPMVIAACAIFLGMVFDALDGRLARMTRNTSELGEQLDSMADMVSFGVAPAFLVVQLVKIGTPFFGEEPAGIEPYFDRTVLVVAGIYVACTALRLARFNIEIDQPGEADHLSFKGLPSPAAAGTVASLVLLHQNLVGSNGRAAVATGVVIVFVALLVALAMVSTVRYSHLINRYLRGRAPFRYVATGVVIVIAAAVHPQLALAAACVAYAVSGPIVAAVARLTQRDEHEDDTELTDASEHPAPAPAESAAPAAPDAAPPLRYRSE